jgi:hypothetical protein
MQMDTQIHVFSRVLQLPFFYSLIKSHIFDVVRLSFPYFAQQ